MLKNVWRENNTVGQTKVTCNSVEANSVQGLSFAADICMDEKGTL